MDIGHTTGHMGSRSEQVENGVKGRNVNGAGEPTVAQRAAGSGCSKGSLRQHLTTSHMDNVQRVSHDYKPEPQSFCEQEFHVNLDDFSKEGFRFLLGKLENIKSKRIAAISLKTGDSERLKGALDVLAKMKYLEKLTFSDMNFCGILDDRLAKFLMDIFGQNDGSKFNELVFEKCKFPECLGGAKDFGSIGLALSLKVNFEYGIRHFSVRDSYLSQVKIAALASVLDDSKLIKTVRLQRCDMDFGSRDLLSQLSEFKCEVIKDRLTLKRQKLNRNQRDGLVVRENQVVRGNQIADTSIWTELNNLVRKYAQLEMSGDIVKKIIFRDCQLDDTEIGNILDAIRQIGGAYYLSFQGCRLNDSNINDLCQLIGVHGTPVCALNLSETNLSADALMKIAEAYRRGCDKNHYLDVSGNNLSDQPEVLEAIFGSFGPLKAIEMSNCALGSKDAAQVKRVIAGNDKIEYIGMSDNNIDDTGAKILGKLVGRRSTLKKVVLNDNFISKDGLNYLRQVNETSQLSELNRIEFNRNDYQFDASLDAVEAHEIEVVCGYLERLKEYGISKKIHFETDKIKVKECLRGEEVNKFVRRFQHAFHAESFSVLIYGAGMFKVDRNENIVTEGLHLFADFVPVGAAILRLAADMGTIWLGSKIKKENDNFGRIIANPGSLFCAVNRVAKILGVVYSQHFDAAAAETVTSGSQSKKSAKGLMEKVKKIQTTTIEVINCESPMSFAEKKAEKMVAFLIGYCRLGFIKSEDFSGRENEEDLYTERFVGILLDCYSPQKICEMIGEPEFSEKFKKKLEKIKYKELDKVKPWRW